MSGDDKVNSENESGNGHFDEAVEERPRWWIRNPAAGVLSAALLGIATLWITLSIKTPDGTPGSTLLYIVILPIALLLPAIALGGAFIAWHGLRASHGRLQMMLAVPAGLAMILNVGAVALFVRWVVAVFT